MYETGASPPMLRGPKFGAASVSRTPFLSLTGRGFTGKAYAALQMGRHGNRVAAAEVPGERSSLVGPRAFVWSRSNETRHHPGGFSFRGKGRTSTAPKGLRFQTKERGSSPPGTMRRAFAALASGGTVGSRWPEGLRRQRSSETRHRPEGAPRIRGEFIFVCRGAL
jgi:hypothetical protein